MGLIARRGAGLLVYLALGALPSACSSDDSDKPQEPVAADGESTPYPEDPDLAKSGGSKGGTGGDSADGLTNSPFDNKNATGTAVPPPPPPPPTPSSDVSGALAGGAKAAEGTVSGDRYVKGWVLTVRSQPNLNSKVVKYLLGGTKVSVEIQGEWAKIKDGQWLRSKYLSETPTRKVTKAEALGQTGAKAAAKGKAAPAGKKAKAPAKAAKPGTPGAADPQGAAGE